MTLPKPQPLPSPNSSPNPRQVGFSFPVAYFLYKLVCGFSFFPFLNFLALFVVMGIGVDDLFVVVDKWHQAVLRLPPDASVADIAAAVGPDVVPQHVRKAPRARRARPRLGWRLPLWD